MIPALLLSLSLSQPPQIVGKPPASGFVVIKPGRSGAIKATEKDLVKVHYVVYRKDWQVQDSSIDPGYTIMRVADMDEPYRSNIMQMTSGEVRAVWIPEIDNIVVTEMLAVIRPPDPPIDTKAPPADALHTDSGIPYVMVKKGDGPTAGPADMVRVNFQAWTPDGVLTDTALVKGGPQMFTLGSAGVFAPLLALMPAGSRAVFWMPAKLVYPDNPKKNEGTVVFDIEVQQVTPLPAPTAKAAPRSIPEPPPAKLKAPIPRRP